MKTVYLTLLSLTCSTGVIAPALADNGGNIKTYESNGVLVTENYTGGQLSGVTKIVPQPDGTKVQQFQPYANGKVAGEPTYTQTTRDNRVARIAAPKENLLDRMGATTQPVAPTRSAPQPAMMPQQRPAGGQPAMGQQQRPVQQPMMPQQRPAGGQPAMGQQQRPAQQSTAQSQRSAGAPRGAQQQRTAQAPQGKAKTPRTNTPIPPNSR